MKKCSACGKEKSHSEFSFNSRTGKDGTKARKSQCKTCCSQKTMEWNKANQGKCRENWRNFYNANSDKRKKKSREYSRTDKARETREQRRFELAIEKSRVDAARRIDDYIPCSATTEEIKVAFTGKCHICGVPEMECKTRLCLDYNGFEDGSFRGWICSECNLGLGKFKDDKELLLKAAAYLEKNHACL